MTQKEKWNIFLAFSKGKKNYHGKPAYSLWLYNRVIFGNFKPKFLQKISDLNRREVLIFLPFVVEIIWMGVYHEVFL
jgi:NADH:ubiquinone oxidoreductase subunit 4 (subunit M)